MFDSILIQIAPCIAALIFTQEVAGKFAKEVAIEVAREVIEELA